MPKGVFNLVNGLGPEVGAAMSEHPDIDMISFTGSTRAGVDVAKRAAPTVKRVSQELGGKSPNVILEGADLTKAVTGGVMHMFNNSGQSCNAPSRMIVPLSKMKEVAAIAKAVADNEGRRSSRRRHHDRPVVPASMWVTTGPMVVPSARGSPALVLSATPLAVAPTSASRQRPDRPRGALQTSPSC